MDKAQQWKRGNEYAPPHVEAAYRDGWNACYEAAQAAIAQPVQTTTCNERRAKKDVSILIHYLRERTHFDADWVEEMLAFAMNSLQPVQPADHFVDANKAIAPAWQPLTDEVYRLARVAINEAPKHLVQDWQTAAMKVCKAIAAHIKAEKD